MAVIKQRTTQLYGGIMIRPRDDTETMSYDLVTPRRYAVSTWGVNGRTSCHQSGTQKVESEPNYWYVFSLELNEDDIRRYLSELGLRPAKMRRGQEIKIDIYIREKD